MLAGACATGIGLGLARFDFGAVGRLMIDKDWISLTSMGDLAGISLGAYLVGSLQHSQLRSQKSAIRLIEMALLVIVLSFWLEAFQSNFTGQAISRVFAGWAAGHLICGIPSLALSGLNLRHRRRGSGLVLAGGGFGALLGAYMIGNFAGDSPQFAWILLGIISILLAAPVYLLLRNIKQSPKFSAATISEEEKAPVHANKLENRWRVVCLVIGGGFLVGAGQVPISLYAPEVVLQRIGSDSAALSSYSLAILGVGSVVGALSAAFLPRRWQTAFVLPLVSIIGVIASVLFFTGHQTSIILLATFLIGVWMWMTASLTYDRLGELIPSPDLHRRTWSFMVSSAGLGYVCFSFSFAHLASSNLNLVLFLGVIVILIQLLMATLQRLKPSTKIVN